MILNITWKIIIGERWEFRLKIVKEFAITVTDFYGV